MAKPVFEIKNLQKTYRVEKRNDAHALNDMNLTVYENESVYVVGFSRCEKTTLLNIMTGLEFYNPGSVTIHEQPVTRSGPDRAVVFQQYALLSWITMRKNIELAMKFLIHDVGVERKNAQIGVMKKMIKSVKYTREGKQRPVEHYIKMMDLEGSEGTFPSRLSRGVKQRMALTRNYVANADMLSMDEPLGALDTQTRAQFQEDLPRTRAQKRKTCLFITRDVEGAVLLATKVVVMSVRPGRIKTIIDIGLSYPWTQITKMEDGFIHYKSKVWEQVYRECLEVKK